MTDSRPEHSFDPTRPQPVQPPLSRAEMDRLGWDELDVLLVSGDAYVDHPAFGSALLARWLMAHGFRVGLVAQPDWRSPEAVAALGRPRLLAGVTAGAMDSMLAHYTAFRNKRPTDAYTPGGRMGARPNRAVLVYTNLVKQAFPGLPVVLGGIEASLRRVSHYDFWSDSIRRSILLDSKADLILYGMAERALIELCIRLARGRGFTGLTGSVFVGDQADFPSGEEMVRLPGHEEILADPFKLVELTLAQERQIHQGRAWAIQQAGDRSIVIAPPAEPLSTAELDSLYALPFTRRAHPSYDQPIPAVEMIRHSVTSHRGCGGGCSFCSLALHQGRRIRSRTAGSIRAEVEAMAGQPWWTGALSDVGGPSANMWQAECAADPGDCDRVSCLWPKICPHFRSDQAGYVKLLHSLADLPGVNHVRAASGIRHDLALAEPRATADLIANFVGGQLKIAPEHISPSVLHLMRKPKQEVFDRFVEYFQEISRRAGKEQYLTPYLMSAAPGCDDRAMTELVAYLKKRNWRPRQVQCFVPTPGTLATAMYASGRDWQGRPIASARSDRDRRRLHGRLAPKPVGAKKPGSGKSGRRTGKAGRP